MWDAVSQTFVSFSEPLAGKVLWMHQDERGLVSIGIGNLVDPVELAVALPERGAPYYDKYDRAPPVTEAQIRADWDRVKHDPVLMGNWRAAEAVTRLRITEDSLTVLVGRQIAEYEDHMSGQVAEFVNFPNWPADAQLGLLSMAWAMGPAFASGGRWPEFRAACANEDWFGAAANCHMVNDWLVKRNAVNRGLFRKRRLVGGTPALGACHPVPARRRRPSHHPTRPDGHRRRHARQRSPGVAELPRPPGRADRFLRRRDP